MRDDLDDRLHELAGTASGSGRLPAAAQLRRTGARRRRVRAGAAGVVAAAVVVGAVVGAGLLQGGPAAPIGPAASADGSVAPRPAPDPIPTTVEPTIPTSPSVTTAPDPTATSAPADRPGATGHAPSPDRQVVLGSPDGRLLAVGADGYLTATEDGIGAATALVVVPISSGSLDFLVKTAELAEWGEPACLYGTEEGDEPGRGVAVTACDASDRSQIFRVARGADPGTIHLGVGLGWITVDGTLVSVGGDDPIATSLTVLDQGPYTDPFD